MAYTLYIGANNQTGKVERDVVERILNKYHDGYTITPAVGYWLGAREDSIVVTIEADKNKVMQAIKELKRQLKQDAIGYQETAPLEFA